MTSITLRFRTGLFGTLLVVSMVGSSCSRLPSDSDLRVAIELHARSCTWRLTPALDVGTQLQLGDIYEVFPGSRVSIEEIRILARTSDSKSGSVKFQLIGTKHGEPVDASYGWPKERTEKHLSRQFIHVGEWSVRHYDTGWQVSESPSVVTAAFWISPAIKDLGAAVTYSGVYLGGDAHELLSLVLTAPIDVNKAVEGQALLTLAATNGLTEVVRDLLYRGADPMLRHTGFPPLYAACVEGHYEIAEILVAHGADVNQSKGDGWTPFLVAASSGDARLVNLMIEGGADLNAASPDGSSAYDLALASGSRDVAGLIEAAWQAPASQPKTRVLDHILVGRWETDDGKAVRIFANKDSFKPQYYGEQASRKSQTSEVGERIWEFSRVNDGRHAYVGRHVWGGLKSGERFWGNADGLSLEVLGVDRIRVIYLDSYYSGGWIYHRKE